MFVKHPPVNSIASFNFTSVMFDEGTTFIFGSWVCVANSVGSFRWHLVDDMKPEASAAAQCSDLNEFINNLDEMLLSDLTREIEEESAVVATSTRAASELLRSDSIRCEEERIQLSFGLRNAASIYQELTQSEFLSTLEEDLYNLFKIGDEGATACREALIFDKYSNSDDDSEISPSCRLVLTITSTPQDRFVYWKGMEPSELIKFDSHLMAFIKELPF
jgi:hypothetical protein